MSIVDANVKHSLVSHTSSHLCVWWCFFFTVLLPQLLRSLLPNPQESRRATPLISAVFLRKEIKKELFAKELFFLLVIALDVSAQRSVKDASLRRRPIACFLCVALRCAGRNRMQGEKKGKENAKTHSAANSSPCIPPCFCSIPLPSSLPPNLIHPLAPPPPLLSSSRLSSPLLASPL